MATQKNQNKIIGNLSVHLMLAVCLSLFGTGSFVHAQSTSPAIPSQSGITQPVNSGLSEPGSQTLRAIEHAKNIEQYEQAVGQLQSEFGPYDQRLLEPLEGLSRTLIESENYKEAMLLLDQQLQIHRVNDGLHASQQIPVIETMLHVYSAAGDWNSVTDTLQYLSWVYQRDTSIPHEQQLAGLKTIGDWHLRALGQDAREREAFHLVQLGMREKRATEIAEQHYGETSEALVPYLYDEAVAELYIALAIMLTGETSQDLMLLSDGIRNRATPGTGLTPASVQGVSEIEALYGSRASTVITRSFKNHMSTSLSKIKRIRDIYAVSGNVEAEAMALMYIGDSSLLRYQFETRPGNFAGMRRGGSSVGAAMTYYTEALAKFREAGLSEAMIEAFTRCPVLLPATVFHQSLMAALKPCTSVDGSNMRDLGEYALLTTLVPGIEDGSDAAGDSGIDAIINFSVGSNGQLQSNRILSIEPDNTANRVRIRKFTELMQFRPALISGAADRTENVRLQVRIPASGN